MRTEKIKISFYRITNAGYYRKNDKTLVLCSIDSLLDDYLQWAKQSEMTMEDTCTYSVDESESFMRCFSYDAIKKNDEYLLCNWNELPQNDGQIPSIILTEPVGSSVVHFTDLPPNSTPGYATYFWFIPEKGVYATIKFLNTLSGKSQMEKTLRSFLYKFSRFTVMAQDTEAPAEDVVIGYREKESDEVLPLFPRFNSTPYVNPGEISEIKTRRTEIVKIVRKNKLDYRIKKEKSLWQKLVDSVGVKEKAILTNAVKIKYEIPYSPSQTELDDIISEWKLGDKNQFEDVGFKLKGSYQIMWLSSSLAKNEIEVKIDRKDNEIVDISKLLTELQGKRKEILKVLK